MKRKAIHVSEHLHRRAKHVATRRGRPLKAVIEFLLERGLGTEEARPEVTTDELQALAACGGSFDFLADDRENAYSPLEGESIK